MLLYLPKLLYLPWKWHDTFNQTKLFISEKYTYLLLWKKQWLCQTERFSPNHTEQHKSVLPSFGNITLAEHVFLAASDVIWHPVVWECWRGCNVQLDFESDVVVLWTLSRLLTSWKSFSVCLGMISLMNVLDWISHSLHWTRTCCANRQFINTY